MPINTVTKVSRQNKVEAPKHTKALNQSKLSEMERNGSQWRVVVDKPTLSHKHP